MINYSDYPKIYEDSENPKSQVISLSHLLQSLLDLDLYGNHHTDLSENLHQSYLQITKETAARKIVYLKKRIAMRETNSSFGAWKKF